MRNLTQLATNAKAAVAAKFILFVVFLTICQHRASCTRIQMFTLYNDTGQSENYTDNVRDLGKVSDFVKLDQLVAVCSQLGVWAFFSNVDFGDKNSYGYHPATPDWTCNTRRIGADHGLASVHSIRHLGNVDLDLPAISLYKEPYFASDELYFDGDIISLPITHKFYSFGFTGNESWTLYVSTNFTGPSTCLRPNLTDGSGVTYETQRNLFVGSIIKGCGTYRTPRLLPFGINNQNDTRNGHDQQGKKTACLELQDAFYNSPLLISGNELRLPEPEPFDSFTLQKNSSWTIFKGMEFSGESMCLKNDISDELLSTKEALNYRFVDPPYLVGSVRQGCEEDKPLTPDNSTSTTMPTESPDNLSETTATTDMPTTTDLESGWTTTMPGATESESGWTTTMPNTTDSRSGWTTTMPDATELVSEWTTTGTRFPDDYFDNDRITDSTIGYTLVTSAESQEHQRGRDSSTRRGKDFDFGDNNDSGPTTQSEFETTTEFEYEKYTTRMPEPFWVTKSTTTNNPQEIQNSTESARNITKNENMSNGTENSTRMSEPLLATNATTTNNPLEIQNSTDSTYARNFTDMTNGNGNSTSAKTQELISDSGAGSLFFVAFIVVLGLLILCMLITLGLFVYFRATRHRHDEIPTTIG